MERINLKNSNKEGMSALPQYKTNFVNLNEHQVITPIINKISRNKMNEEPSLLTSNKARESLKDIDGWKLTDDHKMIYREYILHNFMDAINFIDRLAPIAEKDKHHPDIHLTQYRNLRISLTSHDLGGLSDKDFIVAKKINDLLLINKAVPVNLQLENKKKTTKKSLISKNKIKDSKSLPNRIQKIIKKNSKSSKEKK